MYNWTKEILGITDFLGILKNNELEWRERDKNRAQVCSSDECSILKEQQKHFTSKTFFVLCFTLAMIWMCEHTHNPLCAPKTQIYLIYMSKFFITKIQQLQCALIKTVKH